MESNQPYQYTSADIAKYHKGTLSAAEMHRMEMAALDDPFLADALDGYTKTTSQDLDAYLTDLHKRVQARIGGESKRRPAFLILPGNKFLRMAAMFILVAGIGYSIYRVAFSDNKQEISQRSVPERKEANITPSMQTDSSYESLLSTELAAEPRVVDVQKEATNSKKKTAETETLVNEQSISETVTEVQDHNRNADLVAVDNKNNVAASRRASMTDSRKQEAAQSQLRADEKLMSVTPGLTVTTNSHINTFKGEVLAENNKPLPFAIIHNKTNNLYTSSDSLGKFQMITGDSQVSVSVSYIGYETGSLRLSNKQINRIKLHPSEAQLNEVVVTSMAASRKKINNAASEPVGGWIAFFKYVKQNMQLPVNMPPNQQSMVELSFSLKKSRPSEIRVQKSNCTVCNAEAIRLLKDGPGWIAGKDHKKITVQIRFEK